jgi:hypothetical protein
MKSMKTQKEYEEFITSADIEASGLHPVLTKEIEKLMMPMLKGEQLLGVDTVLLAPKSGKKREYRFRQVRHVPQPFNEGNDLPDITPVDPYDTLEVEPSMFGGYEPITQEALDDADFNVLEDVRTSLAEGMAIIKDSRVWAHLFDTQQVTGEDPSFDGIITEIQLANTGILEVDLSGVTMPVGTTWTIDYVQGWIEFSAAPTAGLIDYTYTTRQVIGASTVASIGYNDIVNARQSIIGDYGQPDTVIIDPLGAGQLLVDDKFIDASAYGSPVMLSGEIGKIAGMNVIGAQNIPDYTAIVMQKGPKLGYTVYKRKIFVTTEPIPKRPGDILVKTWEKSTCAILRPFLIRVILNGNPNSYIHT